MIHHIRQRSRRLVCEMLPVTEPGYSDSQWIYCNHTVHFKYASLTSHQCDTIMSRMEALLDIDPEDLFPEHTELLSDDFEEMGEASASECQY